MTTETAHSSTSEDLPVPIKTKTPFAAYRIGMLVDVWRSGRWMTGKILRFTTRMHVEFSSHAGHMAYEPSMIRKGEIRPHSVPDDAAEDDSEIEALIDSAKAHHVELVRAPDAIRNALGALVDLAVGSSWPCSDLIGRVSCVERIGLHNTQSKNPDRGWHSYDVDKMCPACAAYWHISCARNFALGVRR